MTASEGKRKMTQRPVAEWVAHHPNIQFGIGDVIAALPDLKPHSIGTALSKLAGDPEFPLSSVGKGSGIYIFRQGVQKSSMLDKGDMIEIIMTVSDGMWLATDDDGHLFRVSIAKIS